jgi:hypothetical protein
LLLFVLHPACESAQTITVRPPRLPDKKPHRHHKLPPRRFWMRYINYWLELIAKKPLTQSPNSRTTTKLKHREPLVNLTQGLTASNRKAAA